MALTMAETYEQIYAAHRPRYPQNLLDDLRRRTIGDRGGTLVEWGCGTGELTLPLSPYFGLVRAIDANPARIAIAEDDAREKGIDNVEWRVGRAEELEIAPESCDLVASASAFHWMDRELLSKRAFEGLKPGGAVAIVGGAGDDIWSGRKEWHRVAVECLDKYLERPSPAPQAPQTAKAEPKERAVKPAKKWHTEYLENAGFEVESLQFPTDFVWPVDEVPGYMYSIAGKIPMRLGDRKEAFERDFSEALTRLDPSGVLRDTINFFLIVATKPPDR